MCPPIRVPVLVTWDLSSIHHWAAGLSELDHAVGARRHLRPVGDHDQTAFVPQAVERIEHPDLGLARPDPPSARRASITGSSEHSARAIATCRRSPPERRCPPGPTTTCASSPASRSAPICRSAASAQRLVAAEQRTLPSTVPVIEQRILGNPGQRTLLGPHARVSERAARRKKPNRSPPPDRAALAVTSSCRCPWAPRARRIHPARRRGSSERRDARLRNRPTRDARADGSSQRAGRPNSAAPCPCGGNARSKTSSALVPRKSSSSCVAQLA